MLRKLVREPDVYECACLLVIEGANVDEAETDDEEERGPEEDPALVALPPSADEEDDEALDEEDEGDGDAVAGTAVQLLSDRIPLDLSPSPFFERLITTALDRMPVAVYPEVRARMAAARSGG
jgi:hypothetical protein